MALVPNPNSPAAAGYRMPAEWEPHAATWLSWPHNPDTWPGKFEPIPAVWAGLVRVLSQHEPVCILAGRDEVMQSARRMVGDLPGVRLIDLPTNDCWMRDHGPTFLVSNGRLPKALVDWEYNAWGGKYPPFDLDNRVPRRLAELLGRKCFAPGIVMEGGAVDVNGRGTVLTTKQCLLNPNRNPELGRTEIEQYLADYLAATNVVWLAGGIVGDDTDGHIDELARFVNPTTIVAMTEDDPADENHEPLADNLHRLKRATDEAGRRFEVVTLPMPKPIHYNGQRLPASYANFYVANGVVIAPQFNDPADSGVLETLARLFPNREIRGLSAVDLAWGLGAFHCITQQEPVA